MGDDFRSEDDHVSETAEASDGRRESSAADESDDSTELIRPVSEPPAPASPESDSQPSPRAGGLSEWLHEWEDVRSEGSETDHSDPARRTQELPRLKADTPPDAVSSEPPSSEATPETDEDIDEEEPTGPNPAVRIPSPPQVRSSLERVSKSLRPVRASRPQPVSAASTPGAVDRYDAEVGSVDLDPDTLDRVRRTTTRSVRVGGLDVTIDATQRAMLITATIGMVVVAGLFAYLLSGLGSESDFADPRPDVETAAEASTPNLNVSATSPAAPSMSELARSTVRIAGLDDDGETVCAGSGVLVGEQGVILTNAHVVAIDEDCPFTTIAVGVTLNTSEPPELRYRGEVVVMDAVLDLAVVRIVGVMSSDDPLEINPKFPTAKLGDSDEVELGDAISILGYPVIGGETITQTTGTVAGFVTEEGMESRALMKTDASISAGNSGGMAVNDAGEVIGIPTKAGANGLGPSVDCREVSDTNGDGLIDEDDTCVPIGGFLNSIRPINMAGDLLSRAAAAQSDADPSVANAEPLDLSDVSFWNPRFSTGEEKNMPVDEVITLLEGVDEICLFVDWSGIPNGVPWAAVWSHDGTKIKDFSIFKVWEYGESGRDFWYCAEDRRGHPAGIYEIGLFLNNELALVESIEVTTEPVEVFDVTWVNKSDRNICGLAVNPLAVSGHSGVNMLGPGTTMMPGDSATFELPAGEIVVEAYDCSGVPIAAELDGLSIPESLFVDGEAVPFVIGGSADGSPSPDENDG